MTTADDFAAEAKKIVNGFEARNISDPWFAAKACILTAGWLIGDLSRNDANRARHIATLHSYLEGFSQARFQQTHFTRN
jgi:hypothetical protein